MSELQSLLNGMRTVALAEQAAQIESDRRYREGDNKRERRNALTSLMRPAQKWEYEAWLAGWMAAGGRPTHFYDQPTPTTGWWVALADMVILPLYGAFSINVVVPAGINVTGMTGHSHLYVTTAEGEYLHQSFHQGKPSKDAPYVPVWTDTEVAS